jgi:hypothetical protein
LLQLPEIIQGNALIGAGDGLGKAVPLFERQYLTGSFYLYHSFSVIVAQPLSSMLAHYIKKKIAWLEI